MTTPEELASVLDVFCGECEEASNPRPGRLGRIVIIAGRWAWISHDRRIGRSRAHGMPDPEFAVLGVHAGQVIWAPDFPWLEVPETLRARCRHHGAGTVETVVVLAATRRAARTRRQGIVLTLSH